MRRKLRLEVGGLKTVGTNRRGLGVALFALALVSCGGTSHGGPPGADGGSSAAEHGGSASGGSRLSPSGGAASDAGAAGNSHPVGGSTSIAGTGVTNGGSSAGGVAGATSVAERECRGNRTVSSRDEYLALVAEACTVITGDLTISQGSDLASRVFRRSLRCPSWARSAASVNCL